MPTAREEHAAPLHTAWFDFRKVTLSAQECERLEQLVLRIDPQQILVLVGFTDDIGPQAYNDRLAKQRADACAQLLIEQGIDPRCIRTIGRGRECYLGDNATKAGRGQNRRVEVHYQQSALRIHRAPTEKPAGQRPLHRVALLGAWPVTA